MLELQRAVQTDGRKLKEKGKGAISRIRIKEALQVAKSVTFCSWFIWPSQQQHAPITIPSFLKSSPLLASMTCHILSLHFPSSCSAVLLALLPVRLSSVPTLPSLCRENLHSRFHDFKTPISSQSALSPDVSEVPHTQQCPKSTPTNLVPWISNRRHLSQRYSYQELGRLLKTSFLDPTVVQSANTAHFHLPNGLYPPTSLCPRNCHLPKASTLSNLNSSSYTQAKLSEHCLPLFLHS